ncbi:MAG: hypothetical protein ABI823_20945 [Bryobacteraceae bacterium]
MLSRFASVLLAAALSASAADTLPSENPKLHAGWLKMYDLQFEDAHRIFADWKQENSGNPMGYVSDGAAYLFAELARLGALESEFFTDDDRFLGREKLMPDPNMKSLFMQQIMQSDRLAEDILKKYPNQPDALFARSLSLGLQADYASLVEKRDYAALGLTKESRDFADRLLAVNPKAYDAYLGPGVEQYLLSLKPAPLRLLLRLTGSRIDREKGIAQLKITAAQGHYLEPFAKLLLAVAALRDKSFGEARRLLGELSSRFPNNPLYRKELERLKGK